MRQQTAIGQTWTCHWSHVEGPAHHGRPVRTLVWICEYPYRTMRTKPCDECPAGKTCRVTNIATAVSRRQPGRSHGSR